MKGSRSASSVGVVLHRPLSSFPRSAGFAVRFLYQCRQLGFLGCRRVCPWTEFSRLFARCTNHRMRSRTAGSVANPNSELGFFGCKPGDITSTEAKGWMLTRFAQNSFRPLYFSPNIGEVQWGSRWPDVLHRRHFRGAFGRDDLCCPKPSAKLSLVLISYPPRPQEVQQSHICRRRMQA